MKRKTWWTLSAISLCALPVLAQQTRPDAGTLLQQERQNPGLPATGGAATVIVPPAPPAAPFDSSVRVTPTSFRIQGNTLFTEAQLQGNVAEFVGKPTDMDGLLKAAAAVRRFYRERGYLLTEAYLPQQQLAASGGTVVIQVLEARVGKVGVRVEGEGLSESLANRIVRNHLHTGDHISEYSLDKPILLLRDLSGFDATASVEPGANVGEADITVVVKPFGPRIDGSIGADNAGVRAAGQIRVYANLNVNNPLGYGDQLSARVQASDNSNTNLYRLGYSIPVGGLGTRIGVSATKTEYALGKQFASLGAFGQAKVYGISATHPFIRSRSNNVLGAVTLERKEITDDTTSPLSTKNTDIQSVRFSLLGNFVDNLGTGSFNSYALNLVHGTVDLDAANRAIDQGTSGLSTAGSFSKLNVEYIRTMYFSAASRLVTSLQGQLASKNLASAEKFTLGGPTGVRGYPVGEGVGDAGAIVNIEYQHQLPDFGIKVPLMASVFYDWGRIRYNQNNTIGLATNSESLGSVGFGLTAGTFGNFLVTTQLAWRTERTPLSDPDKRPRVWISVQKWL